MSNLENIFGGPWSPPEKKHVAIPEVQLHDAIAGSGLTPPDHIIMDGKVHRFKSGTKGSGGHGDKTGWYVAFNDGIPAGRFGCWRSSFETLWRADVGREFTHAEEMAHVRRMAEAKKLRDEEVKKKQDVASDTVSIIWDSAGFASPDHPYLKRKGIQPHGARVTGDGRLIVPLYDVNKNMVSLQYISADGEKLYHAGSLTSGCFWCVGDISDGIIYEAEGFATAATVYEKSGRPCIVAYSAANLVIVAEHIRKLYQNDIAIVGDNDKSGVGQKYAEQAGAKIGVRVIIPPMIGDVNDYDMSGGDVAGLLMPLEDDWLIKVDEFCKEPAPISWLIKNWLQAHSTIIVHGPSGSGKTFVVLDWCMHIASGLTEWFGHKVKPGAVVYLAGEGHHGLRSRVAVWRQHHVAVDAPMWLSRDGCDLNTPKGYNRVVDNIRKLPVKPCLIVVDTLHRFLMGDENSAQDTKSMLDACNGLIREFGASVLLVHHTGISDEAQRRLRGSSAWIGGADINIGIIAAKENNPMEIYQAKAKDAELAQPVYAVLRAEEIAGWVDDDGEAVRSAIVEFAEANEAPKIDARLGGYRKEFEDAWMACGAELNDGLPYLTRSALRSYLVINGMTEKTAMNVMSPSSKRSFIGELLAAGIIAVSGIGRVAGSGDGWIVVDAAQAGAMALRSKFYAR